MRRAGDEAHVAVALAAALVPLADDEQTRVFALRARVGLDRHRRVARRLREALLEAFNELAIALPLLGGRERMDMAELAPCDRDHLARGVQLHRARAQRDHGAVERHV